MANDGQPEVSAGVDPLGDLVLTVRGHGNGDDPDYELPPTVPLAQAAEILGLDPADALARARAGTFPGPCFDVGEEPGTRYSVPVAPMIRRVGADRVRAMLRATG
ncbi:hypothetical protein ACIP5N_27800 [Streptomyces sp. NPDC088768]|uniref:hypothetical protein n=1 Tax=Streptomyces sp. NPDC088768 TaxID=3365894 RepID=UPI0038205C3B